MGLAEAVDRMRDAFGSGMKRRAAEVESLERDAQADDADRRSSCSPSLRAGRLWLNDHHLSSRRLNFVEGEGAGHEERSIG
jgi:hypothetical protein